MLEVVTKHLGAVQFEITARGHRVYSDQPVESGGFDEGKDQNWCRSCLRILSGFIPDRAPFAKPV